METKNTALTDAPSFSHAASADYRPIPVYEFGLPGIGTTLKSRRNPYGFYLNNHRQCGPVYRTRHGTRTPIVLGGLEANDFIWRAPENWSYAHSNVAFREQMGFGGGAHICLAMNMTLIHPPLILAKIVRDYDVGFDFDPSFDVRLGFGNNQMRKNVPGRLVARRSEVLAA